MLKYLFFVKLKCLYFLSIILIGSLGDISHPTVFPLIHPKRITWILYQDPIVYLVFCSVLEFGENVAEKLKL